MSVRTCNWLCFLGVNMFSLFTRAPEKYKSCERQDETIKKGVCLLELRRTGMVQWGVCRPAESVDHSEENNPQLSSTIVKEEQICDEAVTAESLVLPEMRKRKRFACIQRREARASRHTKQRQTSVSNKHKEIKHENSTTMKKENSKDRWSTDRYRINHYPCFHQSGC